MKRIQFTLVFPEKDLAFQANFHNLFGRDFWHDTDPVYCNKSYQQYLKWRSSDWLKFSSVTCDQLRVFNTWGGIQNSAAIAISLREARDIYFISQATTTTPISDITDTAMKCNIWLGCLDVRWYMFQSRTMSKVIHLNLVHQ